MAEELFQVSKKRWTPQPDAVYLQEVSQRIPTEEPVEAVAFLNDTLYSIVAGKILRLEGETLEESPGAPSQVRSLHSFEDVLWAPTDQGLFRMIDDRWEKVDDRDYVDLGMHLNSLHAATVDDVYRWEKGAFRSVQPEGGYLSSDKTMVMEDGTQILADPVNFGPLQKIASYAGTLYALRPGELVLFDGRIVDENVIDWGEFPSRETRDLLSLGSRLFIATDRGLAVLRGAALTTLKGPDGLPYEDTTCLAEGFADDLWIGTTRGAIRMLPDDWHYFGSRHWVPGDRVADIAVGDKQVAIATEGGIGLIRYEPYTLRKKVDHYERHLEEWGHKRMGFIHSIYWGGEDRGWIRHISDNDGGHTAPYLAAMCFKYAVTGDEEARREAVNSFRAMVWLEEITPKQGFVARAIWSASGDEDQRSRHGSGGLPAKWYPTEDGVWYWKGDTSSDEIDAHYYAVSLFHDLVAEGAEKERAREHIARISHHILDHGWVLEDMDGKPTRWGRWDPAYLLRPYGFYARGLNGMEAQTYMLTALALTGNPKFRGGFEQLLDWGYHTYTVDQKITFPPEDIATWDDNLAFECYYTLLRYTQDPRLRSIYLRSLERTWEVKRMEHVAWFNFAYSAISGNDGELARAVKHLREWTLDCRSYSYRNSVRADLFPEEGYVPYAGGTKGISPRETEVKGGSRSALDYDGGGDGRGVSAPTGFIRDYWMGRYHGFIEAPLTEDPDLISVPKTTGASPGAPPYSGPPRPE
jgi:hypothetical protein